jgi:cystathionine beta-lyase
MPDHDFDCVIDRRNTNSIKWDCMPQYLGIDGSDLLPMWVSDFDFACPPAVQQALQRRVAHGVFGYSERRDDYFTAMQQWFARRHQLTIEREWIHSVEGVIPGISLLLQLLTRPGEGVVIQGPGYGSFAKIINMNDRRVLDNPLQRKGLRYEMDLPQLARLFMVERPAMMILCNPHNPTGRSWTLTELYELAILCQQHGVTLVSDEIWADLQLDGHRHTSVLSLPAHLLPNMVVATSASKSFGLSSLRISNFIIPDPALRQRFKQRLDAHGLDVFNALSMEAATAAYQYGDEWITRLLAYLTDNRRWFAEQLATRLPRLQLMEADATYLAWIDCHQLELDDDELKQRLIEDAKIVPSMGCGFGAGGQGFIRLNLGCPRSYLEQALTGLEQLVAKLHR